MTEKILFKLEGTFDENKRFGFEVTVLGGKKYLKLVVNDELIVSGLVNRTQAVVQGYISDLFSDLNVLIVEE